MSDDSSPGWEAIDEALRPIYGETEPQHFGTIMKWMMGGNDPLDGVSAYWRDEKDGAAAHWHYVSYGLTELYTKESEDLEHSGYGFELTFRLARTSRDEQAPAWPISLMQNLARYVFQTGNTFGPGHHLNANGPIALETDTKLTAILFADDPELAPRATPHGKMRFLQLIGITADELRAVQGWSSTPFTALVAERFPRLVTDLDRASILDDPSVKKLVDERSANEGSSMGELYVSQWRWTRDGDQTRIVLGAMAADGLLKQLKGRLSHGLPLLVLGTGGGGEHVTGFVTKEGCAVELPEAGYLNVSLSSAAVASLLSTLEAKRGSYRIPELPTLELVVEPTEIKDKDGTVTSVVG